ISRAAQDEFAFLSQEKYAKAEAEGRFNEERVAVEISLGKGKTELFEKDEHPRQTPLENLGTLKPAFKKDGTVTAANASGVNDGAAIMILASATAVKKYGLKPMAKIKSMAVAGVDPAIMGIGPVPASRKALERAGL